jgi:hypothetical protein
MLRSMTYQALSIHARRILDFLLIELGHHAGHENGQLAATYRQLQRFGLTTADIRKGFAELELTGFVRLTEQGLRQAGGGAPSRYALTWRATMVGTPEAKPATNDWQDVLARIGREGVGDVRQARRWLKEALGERSRRKAKGSPTPDIEGASHLRADGRLQVRGENRGNVVALASQVRSSVVGK